MSNNKDIDTLLAEPSGLKPWFSSWQSFLNLFKELKGEVAVFQAGGTPAFGAAIDSRERLTDTSSSTTAYTATAAPAATGSDTIPTGWHRRLVVNNNNAGACTLDVGSSEGPVAIKKYSDGSKIELDPGDLRAGPAHEIEFDGTDLIMLHPPLKHSSWQF